MNAYELFNNFFFHEGYRKGVTATIDIKNSKYPGFELIGHGQENDGKGYRFYILSKEFVSVRCNLSRNKYECGDITSITESSGFEDYHGLMNRYFGHVLVHIALALKVKIVVKFTAEHEVKAKLLSDEFLKEYSYLGCGLGHAKKYCYETIYDDELLKQFYPEEPENANLVFSTKAYNILNSISDIGIDDPTGYPEYREDYIGERYAEMPCK